MPARDDRLGHATRAGHVGLLRVVGLALRERAAGLRGEQVHARGLAREKAIELVRRGGCPLARPPRRRDCSSASCAGSVACQLSARITSSPAASARSARAAPR